MASLRRKGLATRKVVFGNTVVSIFNAECSDLETELKLPDRIYWCIGSFHNKIAFIGDWEEGRDIPWSSRVDLMDPSTGRLSPLPNMRWDGVGLSGRLFCEVYEASSGRWSPLPHMIEERTLCAAVSIVNSSVLVIGEIGRNQEGLRSTELVTRLAGEGGGGGGKKWQWGPFSPMNEEHGGDLLAAYIQGRVYVVGYGEYVEAMEMLDVVADGQWTSLTSNDCSLCQPIRVGSLTGVDNQLFIADSGVWVIGGRGGNGLRLRSTDLLSMRPSEGEGKGGEKLQGVTSLLCIMITVVFRFLFIVVGCLENVNAMEMLDMGTSVNSQLLNGAVPRRQNPIILQTSCAFQAEQKFKNGKFAYRNSHDRRVQTKRSLLNDLEIVNSDTNWKCFSRFHGMHFRRERLDIFINTEEGEEVGAHLIVLSASFPVFR
ncbi:unnamed protein product [Hymenolepis diminuta]|uniref:BTB domain-containing protein n=1 Tax=Hymenolepis diminuta TaxID=6216 RepID=A0A564XVA2_HYMDI|nr:unnamed protein product [Hymenolepis diminuta]